MNHIYLSFCATLLLAYLTPVTAQPESASDTEPPRRISACYLFAQKAPELFYLDAEGEYKAIRIGTHRFGRSVDFPADQQTFTLYRRFEIPSETDDEPTEIFREFKSYELPEDGQHLRLLFYFDADGQTRDLILTDPEAARENFTVRVLNILAEPIAVQVGEAQGPIPPKKSRLFTPVSETEQRFPFTFVRRNESSSGYTTSNTDQLSFIRDNQRLMIVVGYRPQFAYEEQETPENEDAPPPEPAKAYLHSLEVDAIRVYDFL